MDIPGYAWIYADSSGHVGVLRGRSGFTGIHYFLWGLQETTGIG